MAGERVQRTGQQGIVSAFRQIILGVEGMSMLGDSSFFLSGFLMAGGFGVGSDFMWDVNANLGYQWTKSFSTTIGYRYLNVDYEDGAFLSDVSQDGVVLGLSWQF